MEKADIKQALKTVKEFEGVGSFIAGVIVVGCIATGALYGLQRIKFQPFGNSSNHQPITAVSPAPQPTELTVLPTVPSLYQKDGTWYVQGLPATYVVQAGDSSWKVALAVYGSGENYRDIERENGMNPNQDLVVGQKIKLPDVPSKATNSTVTVQPNLIPTATSLPVSTVHPTQTPAPTQAVQGNTTLPTKHTVQKSEGLWQIAQKYYNDGYKYMKIYEANRDKMKSPEDIRIGMELTIPQL